ALSVTLFPYTALFRSTDQARVFAYCTPQGRVMADGLYWRHSEEPDTIYLMLHQSIAETLLRRLQMYVLRAKVTLELLDNSVVLGDRKSTRLNSSHVSN